MSKKIIIGLLLCVLTIGHLTMVSEATATNVNNGIEFFVNYAEPATSEYEGYITFLLKSNTTSEYTITTAFWYSCSYETGLSSPSSMYLELNEHGCNFRPGGSSLADGGFFSVSRYWADGALRFGASSSSSAYYLDFSSAWTIRGYKYSGNVASVTGLGNSELFSIYFAEDGSAMLLMDIISLLQSSNNIDSSILTTVENILNSVDGVENQLEALTWYLRSAIDSIGSKLSTLLDKADRLIDEQEKSNTWLEKIFNYLNESAEKQKQEAQSQGNSSISQGTSSIEDKGAGFTDSIGGLANSMSYTGTQCAWNMPQIKLPAITGVMDEVVLLESQPIDFGQWVSVIPENILLVIQSLLTLALIVYCFRELYNTISYVLTLRKDDNS